MNAFAQDTTRNYAITTMLAHGPRVFENIHAAFAASVPVPGAASSSAASAPTAGTASSSSASAPTAGIAAAVDVDLTMNDEAGDEAGPDEAEETGPDETEPGEPTEKKQKKDPQEK